jgi:cytochrome b561
VSGLILTIGHDFPVLQQAPKEDKGYWMFTHKSLGLLTGMVVAPRLAYRLVNRVAYKVEEVQGSSFLETIASKVVHYGLYAFMIIMPATGIAMGYYGGKGLPFFYTTFSSPVPANDEQKKAYGEIAKNVSLAFCSRVILSRLYLLTCLLAPS